MITIQQWCAVIGSFTQRSSSSYMHDGSVLEYVDDDDDDDAYVEYMHYESVVQYGDTYTAYIYNCVMVLVNMGAFVTLSFIMVAYLLSCGDIESNPGPGLYIVCPSCRGQVHVQRSVCFIFKRKPDMVVTKSALLILLLQLINTVLLQHPKLRIVEKNLKNVLLTLLFYLQILRTYCV